MNTHAIYQAIRLSNYPDEMAWLCFTDSELPEGITDLLRLCTAKKLLNDFAEKKNIDSDTFHKILLNFIEKAILVEGNPDEKVLGLEKSCSEEKRKLHYQLLMRIYHPDINSSPQAAYFSTIITKAYQQLKKHDKIAPHRSSINVSENRMPPKSYYRATQKAESQISNTRSAIAVVTAIFIFTLVALMGHLYDPANPEFISISTNIENLNTIDKSASNSFRKATLNSADDSGITDTELQFLLKNLETAYEKGVVALIKPILANTPEIKGQTDQELSDKLETLFEITSERKMLLFDFDWKNINGHLRGKGKFISRYHLVGEEKWLNREGIATITALQTGKQLKITQLELENNTTDQ